MKTTQPRTRKLRSPFAVFVSYLIAAHLPGQTSIVQAQLRIPLPGAHGKNDISKVGPLFGTAYLFNRITATVLVKRAPMLAVYRLDARSTEGGPLLSVGHLAVDSDKLQVAVSGTGELIDHGEVVTVDFLERLQKHPFAATIIGSLNAALIAWFISLIKIKARCSFRDVTFSASRENVWAIQRAKQGLTVSSKEYHSRPSVEVFSSRS